MVSARCRCYQFSWRSFTMRIFTQTIERFVLVKAQKQNAHKRVLALDMQSLINTALVLMRKKKKKLYEDGLEPGTSKNT